MIVQLTEKEIKQAIYEYLAKRGIDATSSNRILFGVNIGGRESYDVKVSAHISDIEQKVKTPEGPYR